MRWFEKPAFIIDPRTYSKIDFGEFDEMVMQLIGYIFMGCVVVEAPDADDTLHRLLESAEYFRDYYKKYFDKYNESVGLK